MHSESECCQSESRTAKNGSNTLQLAKPHHAPHEQSTWVSSNQAVTCADSATRSPQHHGPGCTTPSVLQTTPQRTHPPTAGSRRCTKEEYSPIRANACQRARVCATRSKPTVKRMQHCQSSLHATHNTSPGSAKRTRFPWGPVLPLWPSPAQKPEVGSGSEPNFSQNFRTGASATETKIRPKRAFLCASFFLPLTTPR